MTEKNNFAVNVFTFCLISGMMLLYGCASISPDHRALNAEIAKAEKCGDIDDYETAAKIYINTIIKAEKIAPAKVTDLKKSLAVNYIEWARTIYWQARSKKSPEKYTKAIYLCEKAAEVYPKYKIRCGKYIARFKKELASLKYKKLTSVDNLLPDKKEREYKIAILTRQGNALRQDGKYAMAKEKFEEVLRLDPYNLNAARQISRIATELTEVAEVRQEADKKVKMAESEWKKVEPIAERQEAIEAATRDIEAGEKLKNELYSMKIASLKFKDTPMEKVFKDLQSDISKALKKDFKFKFDGFDPRDKSMPAITFQVKNIPAADAIDAICKGVNLQPEYSENTVTITKLDK